jgi:hypothetical protein
MGVHSTVFPTRSYAPASLSDQNLSCPFRRATKNHGMARLQCLVEVCSDVRADIEAVYFCFITRTGLLGLSKWPRCASVEAASSVGRVCSPCRLPTKSPLFNYSYYLLSIRLGTALHITLCIAVLLNFTPSLVGHCVSLDSPPID